MCARAYTVGPQAYRRTTLSVQRRERLFLAGQRVVEMQHTWIGVVHSATTYSIQISRREQSLGAPAVRLDLRPQRIHVVEPALVAQPLHEPELHVAAVQLAVVVAAHRFRWSSRCRRRTSGFTPMFVIAAWTIPSIVSVVA